MSELNSLSVHSPAEMGRQYSAKWSWAMWDSSSTDLQQLFLQQVEENKWLYFYSKVTDPHRFMQIKIQLFFDPDYVSK